MLFTGEYERTIDAKQRLAIPAEIRSQMDPERHGTALYLSHGSNGRAWLWPERTFEQLANLQDQSFLKEEEVSVFEELMFSQSQRCEIDKAGRVRLAERMLKEHQLGESVIILGVRDHLELCDPAQWMHQRQQMLEKKSEIMLKARRALEQQRRRASGGECD